MHRGTVAEEHYKTAWKDIEHSHGILYSKVNPVNKIFIKKEIELRNQKLMKERQKSKKHGKKETKHKDKNFKDRDPSGSHHQEKERKNKYDKDGYRKHNNQSWYPNERVILRNFSHAKPQNKNNVSARKEDRRRRKALAKIAVI